ncbi:hypothetical protein HC766_02175 [Candidatus Gracilibacteria bacterium]|nr:hypothetical protein [Candidatus Gracilibacteria bacterium]
MKSNSQNLEPNEVINFETRSFSEFDSELFNEVANEVKILNNSLNKLQNLKELNTIEDILNPN